MKKIFLLIALTLCVLQGFSQHRGGRGGYVNWMTIAVKGGAGTFMMLNQDLKNTEGFTLEAFSPSFCFGGRYGIVFGNYVGISFEYLGGGFKQKFNFKEGNSTINGNFNFGCTDMLALLRYTGDYGFYAEVGPKFTSIKKAKGTIDNLAEDEDVKDQFKDKLTSIAFGMGFMPYNGDRVQVSLGARASYGFKNMVEDNQNPFDFVNPSITTETTQLNVQILLEVNYFFAKFGTANCGRHGIEFFK